MGGMAAQIPIKNDQNANDPKHDDDGNNDDGGCVHKTFPRRLFNKSEPVWAIKISPSFCSGGEELTRSRRFRRMTSLPT